MLHKHFLTLHRFLFRNSNHSNYYFFKQASAQSSRILDEIFAGLSWSG